MREGGGKEQGGWGQAPPLHITIVLACQGRGIVGALLSGKES
jgi:hypothetical protein